MVDMSRSSVEYLCKNVTSPNIARRFGHKLTEGDGQYGGYISQVPTNRSYTPHGERKEENLAMSRYQQALSASPSMDRDLSRKVKSWKPDPSRAVLPTSTVKNKLSEIPKIFVY